MKRDVLFGMYLQDISSSSFVKLIIQEECVCTSNLIFPVYIYTNASHRPIIYKKIIINILSR